MLSIKVLNGIRAGEEFELHGISIKEQKPIWLREDDVVSFSIEIDRDFDNLALALHEIHVPFTRKFQTGSAWRYEWLPKEIYNKKESFFLNYYGMAELSLISSDGETENFGYFLDFHAIEILAKKINAERIASMLDFLSQQDGKDLASAIRITRVRAGYKQGGKTETFLLERIEHNLNFINSILPLIAGRPLSKLYQVARLVIPNNETLIDDRSLCWLAENPDALYQTHSKDESILSIENEYFSTNKIVENRTEKSTNVYENQVFHGFVITLILTTVEIKNKLIQNSNFIGSPSNNEIGYISFFSQINKLSFSINKNKIDKCTRLNFELNKLLLKIKRFLPVAKVVMTMPNFTQKAKYNINYRQIFNRFIAWHRYGAPDWGFQDELNSIKDIPKLFEYYLFCVVKFHLSDLSSDENLENDSSEIANDVFEYKLGSNNIKLMYEPKIWAVGHSNSNGQELVNTEGWTVQNSFGNGSWGGNKNITRRGKKGINSNRSPDIIIEISNSNLSKFIIIDAKYTDAKRAFLNYLPELTMKYIHGIHAQNSGGNISAALIIVNPEENSETRHFHESDYSIYGTKPVFPALLVSSIDVSKAHIIGSNIRNDLSKIVELIINN